MLPLSVLDLAPIVQGSDAAQALHNSLDLARHAERWGYRRFWLAEHHGMPGIASAATAVVIAHVAGGTSTIRVGAGGIMLPNHAPLIVAEQFGTLASLFPGRIDLGLGRAPGSDQATTRALRRSPTAADTFAQDVVELMAYFEPTVPAQQVRAVPGAGVEMPIWILGSSLFGAQLAAELGLPYAFASHFAPAFLLDAAELYRSRFRASERLERPYFMVGVNIIAADEEAEAKRLFTSLQQAFVNLRHGHPAPLPPPVDVDALRLSPVDELGLAQMLAYSIVGSAEDVRRGLQEVLAQTGADEVIVASQIYEHAARLRSYELAIEAVAGVAMPNQTSAV